MDMYSHAQNIKDQQRLRQKMIAEVEKDMTTTIIGLIASVESYFGKSWGLGENSNMLNNMQLRNKKIWDKLRKDMLDKGNRQKRKLLAFISNLKIIGDGDGNAKA